MHEIQMSEYPDDSANLQWDDEWTESDYICPECTDVKMWSAGWYDGSPDDGGTCIGRKYKCGKCGHSDYN